MSGTREELHYEESYRISRKKLKDEKGAKFATLKKKVIDIGLCSSCGACVVSCVEHALAIVDERPRLVGKCTACGVCTHQCPKTKTTIPQLVGDYKAIFTGKTLLPEVEGRGQDGGTVTSLLLYLMRENLVDAAIVLQKDEVEPWKPKPTITTFEEDVLQSAGSVYSQGQTVSALIEAIKKGYHSIAFVGTPCNIDAVTKMEESPYGMVHLFMRAQILKIGLFCMDTFNYYRLCKWIEENTKVDLESANKMAIIKGKFIVTASTGGENTNALEDNTGVTEKKESKVVISVPISKLDHLRASSCYYCVDLTNENADISVGSVGSPTGYNTIIARTNLGLELLQAAADNCYIEISPIPRRKFKAVLTLANKKKFQLYNVSRRRSYVLQTPVELTVTTTPVPKHELVQEREEPDRKMVRIIKQELINNQQNLRMVLKNITGKILEGIKIRIVSISGGQFETTSWVTMIREWFPTEDLEFEFPRPDEDMEFLLVINDDKRKILTRKLDLKHFKVIS
ncbi:MAG: Coenzyme F420 hydrogenase/dehydrogenase, beta subunit C-terminal domain [Candidatus Hodarchaeales archaeon]